jgi:hypothetical protein
MIKSNIQELKEILDNKTNLKIAIIDNNIMGFLVNLKSETDITQLFNVYDLILIPKWVEEEIKDGNTRVDCLNLIATEKDIYIIDEKDYSYLANYKDLELIQLFQAAIFYMGEEKGKIKKYINQVPDIEDLDYDDFIDNLYNNILKTEVAEEGKRPKRKNAGELSITVLSYILGYYYNGIENVAVFTFDKDCYDFIKKAKEILYEEKKINGLINLFKDKDYNTITFKSNDLIYKELYELDNDKGIEIINNIRKNSRYVKYTLKKNDGSIEENRKLLETVEFIELIKLENMHLIF